MKLIFTFFCFIIPFYTIKAQQVFNADLIRKQRLENLSKNLNVLIMVKPNSQLNTSKLSNLKIHYVVNNIYSITTSLQNILLLAEEKNIVRIESIKHNLKLLDDTSDVRNRFNAIKLGLPPLTTSYDGQDIILGIIDSGTDFNHPDLQTASGNTRINYLWDMTKPVAANTPTAFGYGQEWSNSDIDLGICTHDDAPHYGHGTAVSCISAGNGLAISHHAGVAPKADLVVVAMDFDRPGFTIADAVQYIVEKATLLGKPFVINASLGDYYGSHDGTDLETKLIETMVTGSGKCLVAAAGNAGSIPFHVGYNVMSTDTNFSWVSTATPTIELSEYADTLQFKNVKYTIGVANTAYTYLGNIGFKNYNYAKGVLKSDTIFNGTNRIGVVETVASINTDGVYELSFVIKADSLNYLWSLEHTGNGKIDSWNFDYVTASLPSTSLYPKITKYKIADTTQTIVSSFQCSNQVITVANYVNRSQYIDVTGAVQTTTETAGEIAANSSVGPSRDNKIKPDIAATGATLLAGVDLDMLPGLISSFPSVVAQGGYHVTVGGTSSSSPIVAGLAALYLQKNPTATNIQIKQAITNCAYTDAFVTLPVPNYRWGYGKLDGFSAITCGIIPTNITPNYSKKTLQVSPNPVIGFANVLFENNEHKTIQLINSSGQIVFTDSSNSNAYLLNCTKFSAGIYLLVCTQKDAVNRIKILIL